MEDIVRDGVIVTVVIAGTTISNAALATVVPSMLLSSVDSTGRWAATGAVVASSAVRIVSIGGTVVALVAAAALDETEAEGSARMAMAVV